MSVNSGESQKAEWRLEVWCVAVLRLCESFQRELETEVARYPEQWVYFLWRPSERFVPYREPDCIGYSVGNPFDEISESINGEPMCLLEEHECDWPTLLEMTRTCTDLEDWIDELVRDTLRQKRQ